MADRHFQSADNRFGVRIPETGMAKAVQQCVKAGRNETGGILVGRYTRSQDYAVVTFVSDAPRDSQAGGNWFKRGIAGLQQWLNGLWNSKTYYLGEWHFHPFASASPSDDDVAQMASIAGMTSYHCPEPILMIVGGDPKSDWQLRIFVYLTGEGLRELHEVKL